MALGLKDWLSRPKKQKDISAIMSCLCRTLPPAVGCPFAAASNVAYPPVASELQVGDGVLDSALALYNGQC